MINNPSCGEFFKYNFGCDYTRWLQINRVGMRQELFSHKQKKKANIEKRKKVPQTNATGCAHQNPLITQVRGGKKKKEETFFLWKRKHHLVVAVGYAISHAVRSSVQGCYFLNRRRGILRPITLRVHRLPTPEIFTWRRHRNVSNQLSEKKVKRKESHARIRNNV